MKNFSWILYSSSNFIIPQQKEHSLSLILHLIARQKSFAKTEKIALQKITIQKPNLIVTEILVNPIVVEKLEAGIERESGGESESNSDLIGVKRGLIDS